MTLIPHQDAALSEPAQSLPSEKALSESLRVEVAQLLVADAQDREEKGERPRSARQRRALGERLLTETLERHTARLLTRGEKALEKEAERRVMSAAHGALFGLGGLQQLLDDAEVENIDANGCDGVFVRYADGRKEQVAPIASSDGELVELIRTVAARGGEEERRFDRAVPRLNVQLPDGSRMFAVMAVSGRVSLSIRRHRYPRATLAQLRDLGAFDEDLEQLLRALVRARKNIIVAGGTNVGKTTLLRALASEIPASERLVTIEDTFELGLHQDSLHPDVVPMQAREANIEGEGAIDQAELVRWGLRMAPDRVIVGEIRGAEVVPMCNAMSQGNDGSLSTIHASTSRGVFTKLAAYAVQAPERLSLEATNLLVASAVHFVIHLARDTSGRRAVSSIREIIDADGGQLISNEVYRPGPDRRAVPAVPLRAATLDDLAAVGYRAPQTASGWSL
ncbi:type II secretion system protein E [Streptomyces tateyamensis]|uniref:Type II secretion system protein E n=1 Tax=Streptomyces tateyamensis TaxID=565073 RepID=A0A2V4NHR9_9ACTN|nr:ATPase, T2SS/T4P/T4SS family [Streptomyces tateyamensis]PYC65571.1 type II secretion system protein E [Streptomyces tateyamensis]